MICMLLLCIDGIELFILNIKNTTWCLLLTLILLTWRIWWAVNNASRWQMGFNLVFKGLKYILGLFLYFFNIMQKEKLRKFYCIFCAICLKSWCIKVTDIMKNRKCIPLNVFPFFWKPLRAIRIFFDRLLFIGSNVIRILNIVQEAKLKDSNFVAFLSSILHSQ